jgi:DNA-binding NtrC family response regulator
MKITTKEKHEEIAIALFGINKLIKNSESLLEKLDENGTLFIDNIELLSLETQRELAQYLKFGYFHPLKTDHKKFSSTRIICSTSKNLAGMIEEGTFSKELFEELQPTTIIMPSLNDEDITALAQGFADQAVQNDTFKHLLSLSEKDTKQFSTDKPLSIHELKEQVQELLKEKSRKHNIAEITEFDPAYHVTDPELAQAVRLGKKALRDPRIMALLWHKFKNQNKIAQLLGVNRSSVNRRCQEFNLK